MLSPFPMATHRWALSDGEPVVMTERPERRVRARYAFRSGLWVGSAESWIAYDPTVVPWAYALAVGLSDRMADARVFDAVFYGDLVPSGTGGAGSDLRVQAVYQSRRKRWVNWTEDVEGVEALCEQVGLRAAVTYRGGLPAAVGPGQLVRPVLARDDTRCGPVILMT